MTDLQHTGRGDGGGSTVLDDEVDVEEDETLRLSALDFAVVGIGASAGGMTALQRFFEQMPDRTGIAFVVVLHLSPKHESNAAAILQRTTRMPVSMVDDVTPVEADHVYVIPPTKHLTMDDGVLRLSAAHRNRGRHVSIDLFFRTLAQVHREKAIAVVLSGTGADGAVGIARIKERGGLTFAQLPEDAEYDGMPQGAIATGSVDFVLPVVEIPQRLLELAESARAIRLPPTRRDAAGGGPDPSPGQGQDDDVAQVDRSGDAEIALRDVKALVKKTTGHDFTQYKRATVLRRIERRLQVRGLKSLPEYRAYLEEHAEEVGALLQDLLISVTNFFRDRDAFEALERDVVPALLRDTARTTPLRVWVAGCATGEEAYSIGMQLRDWADLTGSDLDFQIFATDIDDRALANGRAGRYPLSIVTDVTAARLRKYFTRDGDHYRVAKTLRERVLFARHNLLRDPPFSGIDLVCCRNLLIYLDREAQRKAIDNFRFSLGASGSLFLGTSESAELADQAFVTIDKKHRLYRVNALSRLAVGKPAFAPSMPPLAPLREAPPPSGTDTIEHLHQQAKDRFSPPSVLIDGSHQILHLSEGVGRFLEHAGGTPSHHVVTVVAPALRLELRTALFTASQTGQSVEAQPVVMRRNGKDVYVNIVVRPFRGHDDSELILVAFDEVEATMRRDPSDPGQPGNGMVERLEAELKKQKELLQDSLVHSVTSTEELKASNEELQAINEELRSTSEELETGKEELQSMNEELITVNDELKTKIDETGKVNDDLQNLIASTDVATIFVDGALNIKRYTPRALELFNLIPSDVGRSLLDIRHQLRYDELADDAAEAFRTLQATEREVGSERDRRYLVRLLPYRTTSHRIDGATITFIDVTSLRDVEARLREGEARVRLATATTKDFAIMTMDDAGIIATWNEGAQRMFGYTVAEIVGQPAHILFTPEDRAAGVPDLELSNARRLGRAEDDRWHLRKDNTRFFCSGVVTPFESGELRGLAKIARDITGMRREQTSRDALLVEERAARAQYEAAARLKDELLAVMSHELKDPLNLIHVNAELLTRMQQVREIPAVQRAAQTICKTVVTQGKIIDDLLDMSRVRTGKLTLHIEAVSVATTVDTIVAAVRPDATKKKIAIDMEVERDLPSVAADPSRVEQIVWNLLSNAIKFTPAGGRIALSVSVDGGDVRLTVADSGRGISANFLPHVFEMFGQESNGPGRHEAGLGIGLALVRELALAHGGRVEARSDGLGRGACFSVWLPSDAPDGARRANDIGPPGRSLAGLQILVVEDSRETIEPFVELLRIEGAVPTAALDGREALALLGERDFDLIISDIAMPDIGGYEFIAEVRRHPRAARVVAIALTGFGRGKDKEDAHEAGFDAHVRKPASIADIRRVLATIDERPRRPS